MLAPSDLEQFHQQGDQTVSVIPDDDQPGLPPSTERPVPWFNQPKHTRQLVPLGTVALTATATQVYRVDQQPDWWLVSLPLTNGVRYEVHYGEGLTPAPIAALGPGGWCRIPGRGTALTLRGTGSAGATPTVVAASGWGDMNAGDVAIVPGVYVAP